MKRSHKFPGDMNMNLRIRTRIELGVSSGAFAGMIFIVLYSFYLAIVLMVIYQEWSMGALLFVSLIIGIPIGLLAGALFGLFISLILIKFITLETFPRAGLILGSIGGIIYPLILIFTGDDSLWEIVAALFGGPVLGGYSGWLGGRRFCRWSTSYR